MQPPLCTQSASAAGATAPPKRQPFAFHESMQQLLQSQREDHFIRRHSKQVDATVAVLIPWE